MEGPLSSAETTAVGLRQILSTATFDNIRSCSERFIPAASRPWRIAKFRLPAIDLFAIHDISRVVSHSATAKDLTRTDLRLNDFYQARIKLTD